MDGDALWHSEPDLGLTAPTAVNTEIEMALLGALLVDPRTWDRVIEAVPGFGPEVFYDDVNRIVCDAIDRAAERGQTIDVKMIAHSIGEGGGRYVAELAAGAMNIIDAPDYAHTLTDLALARDLNPILRRASERVHHTGPEDTAQQQIADVESDLFALAEKGLDGEGPKPVVSAAASALRRAEAVSKGNGMIGLGSGIRSLDEATGGLAAPDLIILAGRPGMGKTKFGTRIAFNVARQGKPVVLFSMEMSSEQLATAELSSASDVPLDSIRRGRVAEGQWSRLLKAQADMEGIPLHIDDTPAMSPAQMRARARRHKRRHGLALIVVDYLQLMRAKGNNRNEEITIISQSLKALAKELDVPVIALSQLSRGVEQRDDKRPVLSDLRDSGSIEQDADLIWMLYRPDYYAREPHRKEKESPEDFSTRLLEFSERQRAEANLLELNIAKFRQGQTCTLQLFADLAKSRFGDFDQHPEAPF